MAVTDHSPAYTERRARLADYFDRTASETWARLTSDAPVSRIRATVRAGRERMRATMLSWLPEDLRGARVLDAGCGTGATAMALAARGAEVVAVDIAGSLVTIGEERAKATLPWAEARRIAWLTGDMLDPALGRFDHVVAMDSLIHYRADDMARALARLAGRADGGVVTTFAPRTVLLAAMHASGKLFPRSDRSPAIEPVTARRLTRLLDAETVTGRRERVSAGFYISEAMEVRAR